MDRVYRIEIDGRDYGDADAHNAHEALLWICSDVAEQDPQRTTFVAVVTDPQGVEHRLTVTIAPTPTEG